jgi:Uma2 family endonuclease
MATSRTAAITFEEFCRLVNEDQKADLIDGVIYMASPENADANDLVGWLYWLLRAYVRKKDLGKVYFSRVAYRLDNTNAPEPDIGFIRQGRLHAVRRGSVQGPPDLAIEVASPESVERDYERKRQQYERFGVREYWIVDEVEERLTVLRLVKGTFREVRPRRGVVSSRVLPGFWLRPEWLWQEPLPDEMATLKQILKGPPRAG